MMNKFNPTEKLLCGGEAFINLFFYDVLLSLLSLDIFFQSSLHTMFIVLLMGLIERALTTQSLKSLFF